jgi:hypothetical protein
VIVLAGRTDTPDNSQSRTRFPAPVTYFESASGLFPPVPSEQYLPTTGPPKSLVHANADDALPDDVRCEQHAGIGDWGRNFNVPFWKLSSPRWRLSRRLGASNKP